MLLESQYSNQRSLKLPLLWWIAIFIIISLQVNRNLGYAYSVEFFIAWYSNSEMERFAFINRAFGNYWWAFWTMISCNVLIPQVFWFKKCRTSPLIMWAVCIFVNIGMWFERFVIIITSLTRDFLPSSWGEFRPSLIDILMLIGSFGLFITLFLLFCRFLPMVAMAEVRQVMPEAHAGMPGHEHEHVEAEQVEDEQDEEEEEDEVEEDEEEEEDE